MDVDHYDDEIIVYLWDDEIKRLKKEKSIYDDSEEAIVSVHYDDGRNTKGKRFDDILDALEEVDQMLWQLESGDNFNDIKDDFEWKKVMRTYEYYDKIRQQYE